jgi:hypothetical protein
LDAPLPEGDGRQVTGELILNIVHAKKLPYNKSGGDLYVEITATTYQSSLGTGLDQEMDRVNRNIKTLSTLTDTTKVVRAPE